MAVRRDHGSARAGAIEGRLWNGRERRHVGQALVIAFRIRAEHEVHAAITDVEGQFRVVDLSPGQYKLAVVAGGRLQDGFSTVNVVREAVHTHLALLRDDPASVDCFEVR
ncbi:MAG: carboxypeptidase regulatory-like domain-containing protein [Deltaproteobacteria bacterium]|nr:carboxypeptidase regulatory-like domain-containing protein [Deltaproteobacteria bacterium]